MNLLGKTIAGATFGLLISPHSFAQSPTAAPAPEPAPAPAAATDAPSESEGAAGDAEESEAPPMPSREAQAEEPTQISEGEPPAEPSTPEPEQATSEPPANEGKPPVDLEEEEPARKKSTKKTPPPASKKKSKKKPKKPAVPPPDYEKLPWTYHQERIDLAVGVQVSALPAANFEMFRDDHWLPGLHVRGAKTVWVDGNWAAAAGFAWEMQRSTGSARQLETTLEVHRFQLTGEGRFHLSTRLAAYGRVGLGGGYVHSALDEEAGVASPMLNQGAFVGSAVIGASGRLLGEPDGRKRGLRAHLFVELGATYLSRTQLKYEIGEDGPLRPDPVELGHVSLGGPQLTVGTVVAF